MKYIPSFDEGYQVDPGFTKFKRADFRINEIWDDTQDFFDAKLKTSYVDIGRNIDDSYGRDLSQIHCTPAMFAAQTC